MPDLSDQELQELFNDPAFSMEDVKFLTPGERKRFQRVMLDGRVLPKADDIYRVRIKPPDASVIPEEELAARWTDPTENYRDRAIEFGLDAALMGTSFIPGVGLPLRASIAGALGGARAAHNSDGSDPWAVPMGAITQGGLEALGGLGGAKIPRGANRLALWAGAGGSKFRHRMGELADAYERQMVPRDGIKGLLKGDIPPAVGSYHDWAEASKKLGKQQEAVETANRAWGNFSQDMKNPTAGFDMDAHTLGKTQGEAARQGVIDADKDFITSQVPPLSRSNVAERAKLAAGGAIPGQPMIPIPNAAGDLYADTRDIGNMMRAQGEEGVALAKRAAAGQSNVWTEDTLQRAALQRKQNLSKWQDDVIRRTYGQDPVDKLKLLRRDMSDTYKIREAEDVMRAGPMAAATRGGLGAAGATTGAALWNLATPEDWNVNVGMTGGIGGLTGLLATPYNTSRTGQILGALARSGPTIQRAAHMNSERKKVKRREPK